MDLVKREEETALVKKEDKASLMNKLESEAATHKFSRNLGIFSAILCSVFGGVSFLIAFHWIGIFYAILILSLQAVCVAGAAYGTVNEHRRLKQARKKLAFWKDTRGLAEHHQNLLEGDLPSDDATELCQSWEEIAKIEAKEHELTKRKKKLTEKTEREWLKP